MSLPAGGVYPAQALLFAYLINDLLNPDLSAMRSRANFLSVWWIVIATVLFFSYLLQGWAFGYANEKMVRPCNLTITIDCDRQEECGYNL